MRQAQYLQAHSQEEKKNLETACQELVDKYVILQMLQLKNLYCAKQLF